MLSESGRVALAQSAKAFSKKTPLLSLWQEISENFYPERADFTYQRTMGESFASDLADSAPVLMRRELGNSLTSMLRPTGKDWGIMTVRNEDELNQEAKRWLEWAWDRERNAMYARNTLFTRATKEGDHDFATYGQCVIHVGLNKNKDNLLFKSHHLRDCAWSEGADGLIDTVYRKTTLSAHALVQLYGIEGVHPKVAEMVADQKRAFEDVRFQHIMMPSELYREKATPLPYMSMVIDTDNKWEMEVRPSRRLEYVVPRWQTVSGSAYAFSPSTIIALPDARTIQTVGLTLLEAGERTARPPMIATEGAVRSDLGLYPGGVTWVDSDYDEKLGEALRPLMQANNMPVGWEMSDRQKEQLRDAFYLNQIGGMPLIDKVMTAYEASQHVQNYIRQAMPLFEPMEHDYNGGLCEEVFQALFWAGGFGSPQDIPESLQGKDIDFEFKTPLHDAMDKEKAMQFQEMFGLTETAATLDPTVVANLNINKSFRDSLEGMRIPAEWLLGEQEAEEAVAAAKQEQSMAAQIEQARLMGEAGEQAGKGAQAVGAAGGQLGEMMDG